jgi:Iap family predicted aminopeptidase
MRPLPRGAVVAVDGGGDLDALAERALARGAGALLVVAGDAARYAAVRAARGPARFWVAGRRIPGVFGTPLPVLFLAPAAGARLGAAADTADAPTLALEVDARFSRTRTWNVVARLPGADPALRHEHVALVAHHDHLGVMHPQAGTRAANGDSVYNGFMDDAVGVAAVLGVAGSMRARPPRRSVLFLLTGAEEQGSLGSAFFLRARPAGAGRIVAAVNLDAGAPLAPPRSWLAEGAAGTRIAPLVTRAAAACGWSVELAPPLPTSDQWSFARAGVPAFLLVPGEGWEGVTREEEERLVARWWRAHRPDDEWGPDFPWAGAARYATFARDLVYLLGGSPRPAC